MVSSLEQQQGIIEIMSELGWEHGQKHDISAFPELRARFVRALNPTNIFATPGGSAANTLCTLRLLLPEQTHCALQGIVGHTAYRATLLDAFAQVGAELIEVAIEKSEDGVWPSHALAYLLVDDSGGCSVIRVEDGHARTAMQPEHLAKAAAEKADYLFFSASLFYKFSPSVALQLLAFAADKQKSIILALPTRVPLTPLLQERVKEIIRTQAIVTLGNALELRAAYGADDNAQALRKLQHDLRAKGQNACAFITNGSHGAWVVNAENIEEIAPVMVPKEKLKSTAGAGDASYAGFLAGWLQELPLADCGKQGMQLGSLAVQRIYTRLNAEDIKSL